MHQTEPDRIGSTEAVNYEKLKGEKAGLSSVRVNDQYRIEFIEKTINKKPVATPAGKVLTDDCE